MTRGRSSSYAKAASNISSAINRDKLAEVGSSQQAGSSATALQQHQSFEDNQQTKSSGAVSSYTGRKLIRRETYNDSSRFSFGFGSLAKNSSNEREDLHLLNRSDNCNCFNLASKSQQYKMAHSARQLVSLFMAEMIGTFLLVVSVYLVD